MSGLVDVYGNPIRRELTSVADAYSANDSSYWGIDPGVKGGWQIAGGFNVPQQPISQLMGMALDRDTERRASRIVYMTNPIMYGALETIQGFILGEGISYGETADPLVDEQVEEFWFQNNWEHLEKKPPALAFMM
ncbi:MAG: hypothetical protein LC687_07055 [Actinobacteria bacterium]|nr:hypothetical protein [Actinomycetota bacterium]